LPFKCFVFARFDPRDAAFEAFFGLTAGARLTDLAARKADRCFVLAGFAWVAFNARAFPAAERLVAGFNRVDLALEADLTAPRADDREESFFELLAKGVLMRNSPRSCGSRLRNSAQKQAG
jgi:hypothetical protein